MKNIIATHGGRIRCLLQKYFKDQINNKMGFNNCAVIKISANGNYLYAELIYEGENSSTSINKKKHHTKETFGKIKSNIQVSGLMNCEIYLIRHGEGYHNTYSLLKKMTIKLFSNDPKLTLQGIQQAQNCGKFLKSYFAGTPIKFKFYGSYMNRAYTTMAYIMENMNIHSNTMIRILPCLHEIPYKSNGNCDKNIIYTYAENTPKCFDHMNKDYCKKALKYKLSWAYFIKNGKYDINKFNCHNIDLFYFISGPRPKII
jgi:broad specificity phosphatase PhoE